MTLLYNISAGTSNQLNDKDEGYENITVARHLGLPDLEMLQFVHSQITPGKKPFLQFTVAIFFQHLSLVDLVCSEHCRKLLTKLYRCLRVPRAWTLCVIC